MRSADEAPLYDELVRELGDPLCSVRDVDFLQVSAQEDAVDPSSNVVSLDRYRSRRARASDS